MPDGQLHSLPGGRPSALDRIRTDGVTRPGRWYRRCFVAALAALVVGAVGTLLGVSAVEDLGATLGLVLLVGGSLIGLVRPTRARDA
jgi:hypothetical protein